MASSRVIAIRSGICGCFRFSKELKKRKIDPADFTPLGDQGLRVYELAEGRGDAAQVVSDVANGGFCTGGEGAAAVGVRVASSDEV